MTPAERQRMRELQRRGLFLPDARAHARLLLQIDERRKPMEQRSSWILFAGDVVFEVFEGWREPEVRALIAARVITHAQLWEIGKGKVRELPEALLMPPPLVQGGQGRDAGDVTDSGFVVAACLVLGLMATVGALAVRQGWM